MSFDNKENQGENIASVSSGDDNEIISELKDLAAKEDSFSATTFLVALLLSISVMTSIYSIYSIVTKLGDHTIPLVQCPKSYDLDSPVILPVIRDTSIFSKDKWVRGFIRKYVTHQFPRNEADAESSLKYVSGRSSGKIKDLYEGRLNNIDKFKTLFRQGYYYSFYAKDIEDGKDIRIRRDGIGTWAIEVDGYMVHRLRENEVRTTPTLRYTVKSGPVTLENPEGLYVTWSNQDEYKDPVSGEKQ